MTPKRAPTTSRRPTTGATRPWRPAKRRPTKLPRRPRAALCLTRRNKSADSKAPLARGAFYLPLRRSGQHDCQGKAVIAFAAYGLDLRGAHALFGGQGLVEGAYSLHIGIAAGGARHLALAHHVVSDDQGSGAGKRQA